MIRPGIYIRVSTTDQLKGLESQKRALHQYLDGHGITKAKWYVDRISGTKSKRPALDRLQRDIFNGRIKTVVVWSLDRLTRKGPRDGLDLLASWLKQGVRVVSVTEQFDFYGDTGELVASVLFSIAKMFRTKLSENTKRGLAAAKARGVKLGKRPKLFAKDITLLLTTHGNMTEVAKRLKVSRQACYLALKREGVSV